MGRNRAHWLIQHVLSKDYVWSIWSSVETSWADRKIKSMEILCLQEHLAIWEWFKVFQKYKCVFSKEPGIQERTLDVHKSRVQRAFYKWDMTKGGLTFTGAVPAEGDWPPSQGCWIDHICEKGEWDENEWPRCLPNVAPIFKCFNKSVSQNTK